MKFIEEINNYRRISKLPLLEQNEKPIRTILKDVWDMVFAKEVKVEIKESILTIKNPITGKRARVDEQYAIDLTKKDIAKLKGTDLEIYKSLNDNLIEYYGITAVAKSLKTSLDLIQNKSVRFTTEDYVLERCFRERSAEISDEIIRLENIDRPSPIEPLPKDIDIIIKNEVDKLPEGGAFFDESLPLLENCTEENAIVFLENKGKSNGLDVDSDYYKNLYNLADQALRANGKAMEVIEKTNDILISKIKDVKPSPPINPTSPPPSIKGWEKIKTNIGYIYGKGMSPKLIKTANYIHTVIQIGAMMVDVATVGYKQYRQPVTDMKLGGVILTKLVALAMDATGGKILFAVNNFFTIVDLGGAIWDYNTSNKKDDDTGKPLDIETNKLARLAITADDAKKWVESETNPLGLSGDDFANVKYEEDTEEKIVNVYVSGSPDSIKLIKTVRLGVVEL
jgi:hypothetical protein